MNNTTPNFIITIKLLVLAASLMPLIRDNGDNPNDQKSRKIDRKNLFQKK